MGARAAGAPARPLRAARVAAGPRAGRCRIAGPPDTDAPSPRRHRARRGEGELLRDEILAAAERLLVATGDERSVSIRAVADAVGVTPPSIYLHFADKDELLHEVCQRHFTALDERMVAAGSTTDDPLESLLLRGLAYIRFGLENPEHYRILFMAAEKPATGQDGEVIEKSASLRHMVEAVTRCMDAGLLRRGDPRLVTLGLWATAHGLTSLLIAKPNFGWPDPYWLAEQVLRSHVEGLLAPGAVDAGPPAAG